MRPFYLIILLYGLFMASCDRKKTEVTQTSDEKPSHPDWSRIGALLLERMDLQAGEKVLLVATPGRFDPLIEVLKTGVLSNKAEYLGTISVSDSRPDHWNTDFTVRALQLERDSLKAYLRAVDLGIMLPGPTPGDLVYKLIQENLTEGRGRTIHFHWSGAYGLNGQPLKVTPEIDQFYQTALLETDYGSLAESQRTFEENVRGQVVTVTTPGGTNVSFSVGDRPVTRQDGDASAVRASQALNLIDREVELPAGAIRVAPLEETVGGVIVFPDAEWEGELVTGLRLTFDKGKVVDIQAEKGLEAVKREMEIAGEAGRSFREFALGFNPMLAIPSTDPWIPYYGYGTGVVRLSLGDNTELGGKVTGGYVRWNFFTDATVKVGKEVWVQDGKLVR